MLKKIINQLEEAKYCKHDFYQNGIDQAISIIKQHEKENSNRVDKVLRISPSREQIAMVNDEGITEIFIRQDVVISQYQHQLSDEDIERAAKSHSDDRDSQMSFIVGANFAKQPIANEWVKVLVDKIIEDIEDRCGLGDIWNEIDSDTQYEIKSKWVSFAPHPPKK